MVFGYFLSTSCSDFEKIALSQAPSDTTYEYPDSILLIIFLGNIFLIFGFFTEDFSKTRTSLEILFTVLKSAHLNASKLFVNYEKNHIL